MNEILRKVNEVKEGIDEESNQIIETINEVTRKGKKNKKETVKHKIPDDIIKLIKEKEER